MCNNLPELVKKYPIGIKIKINDKNRNDYVEGKFTVDGYLYDGEKDCWYVAHQMYNGAWEIYKE